MARVEYRSDGNTERRVLIGMISDSAALGRISPKWEKPGLLKSPWANLIAEWCISYYRDYNRAPGATIQTIFEQWAAEGKRDEDEVERIGEFLGSLSDQYDALSQETNTEYTIDLTAKYLDKIKILKLKAEIEAGIEQGRMGVQKVLDNITSFRRTDLGTGHFIDVLRDEEAMQRAFSFESDRLIEYPGPLGEFFGASLERDGFIAIQAPDKRFKSVCLLDMAWVGLCQRRKVAFFQAGDLSERQIMKRFMIRAARRPAKAETVRFPTAIRCLRGEKFATVQYEFQRFEQPMVWQEGKDAFDRIIRRRIRSEDPYLFLSCHPADTLSAADIGGLLDEKERDGWSPDLIVVDYADILAPINKRLDARDQINETWLRLRALSQERHCLVLTATQASALAYRAETIRRFHFSNDKRKLAHVTGMIGISITEAEKEQGILRMNWLVLREAAYSETKMLHCAGVRSMCAPLILSTWGDQECDESGK